MDFPYENPNSYFIPNPTSSSSSLFDQVQVGVQLQDIQNRDRFPQWSEQETKVLLNIRAELDYRFTETKRNKALWEEISMRMQQIGFNRTSEQCKSKWKNLVARYKGTESIEGGADRQFPFAEEMKSIFSDRMERLLQTRKLKQDDGEEQEEDKYIKKKKKKKKECNDVAEVLREFGHKQIETEMRMMEYLEAREAERRYKEEEWKKGLITAQEERNAMERRWREREEERWVREDARDERRHAIITSILSKIDDFI